MADIKVEDLKVYFHSERMREDGENGLAFIISIFPIPEEPDIEHIAKCLGDAIKGIKIN